MSIFDFFCKKGHPVVKELKRLAKNSIVINTNNSAAGLRPDASKFGGKPFLPASFEWPEYADPDEGVIRPLTFFCQINLAEAAPFDRDGLLPKTGILSFFYEWQSYSWGMDAEQQKAAKVFTLKIRTALYRQSYRTVRTMYRNWLLPSAANFLTPHQTYLICTAKWIAILRNWMST